MSWRDLLTENDPTAAAERVLPWLGGRRLQAPDRAYQITGPLPQDHGWYLFDCAGRKATLHDTTPAAEPCSEIVTDLEDRWVHGFLIGDRLCAYDLSANVQAQDLYAQCPPVRLLPAHCQPFCPILAVRMDDASPLVYIDEDWGVDTEVSIQVYGAYSDALESIDHIKGATPAMYAAFKLASYQRAQAAKRRAEAEAQARRAQLIQQLGDAAGRRALAQAGDFPQAAAAALRVGGAEYITSRPAYGGGVEYVVQFRFAGRRFECTADCNTLRIIDSGICLAHHGRRENDENGFERGEQGDTFFTLESLPAVIQEAINDDKLVVYRHV